MDARGCELLLTQLWSYRDLIEYSSNPFDLGKSITGLGNEAKKTPFQKK
jgi:hypothetical protein